MVVVFVVVAVLVTSAFAPKRYMTFGIGTSSGCNKSRGVSNLFGDEANSTYLIIDCMLMPLVSPHRGNLDEGEDKGAPIVILLVADVVIVASLSSLSSLLRSSSLTYN